MSFVLQVSRAATRQNRSHVLSAIRNRNGMDNRVMASSRRFLSSDSSEQNKPPPTLQNIALASALLGFCGFVFTYSLNAVGKSEEEVDPLSQLKAEAQEARESKNQEHNKRLTAAEIEALESGLTGGEGKYTAAHLEVAVAAPAEVAQLEEEANLRAFRAKEEGDQPTKTRKPWWRFGF